MGYKYSAETYPGLSGPMFSRHHVREGLFKRQTDRKWSGDIPLSTVDNDWKRRSKPLFSRKARIQFFRPAQPEIERRDWADIKMAGPAPVSCSTLRHLQPAFSEFLLFPFFGKSKCFMKYIS
ncbi:MAG: hypothetical protein C4530_09800 [Desulfobacteraceae bacterium]|nr:MAG: hypothetical protein C4530_09800 [Desulfobacteraceae bacterium]